MPPKKELTSDQRKQIVSQLLLRVKQGHPDQKLMRGALSDVAKNFNVTGRTVGKIWKRARQSFADPTIASFRASPLKKNCGRKQKFDRDEVRDAIREVPLNKRNTLRRLALSIGLPLTTVHRMKEDPLDSVIVPHSNAIKPHLHDYHQLARVLYAVENLDLEDLRYRASFNSVHIDEKWFFLTEAQLNLYLVPGEAPPTRSTRHKSHILKVMFLAAVARPRFNTEGQCTFDGKIGIWPFIERVRAQRDSINRQAGTWETKPVSVTAERYRNYLLHKVLPAIKARWPDRERNVTIQQDGASSHIRQNDPAFVEVATAGNWDIKLLTQPAQSPDTNLLDLTFFRALQSSQWNHGFANEINGLVHQVTRAYGEFPPRKIDFGFLTLQCCLEEILLCNGANTYKVPHMGKERLLRAGTLPVRILASANAISVARQMHDANG
jgi:hypothetical protein